MTNDQKQKFCEALGIRLDQVKVERVAHPTKRGYLIFRVSHPRFGEGIDQLEALAWKKFMDAAEKQTALPTRCQATKKDGQPCQNAPQHGEQFCGPHLTHQAKPSQNQPSSDGKLCEGMKASGQPCRNRPQQGERFCGPHLVQHQKQKAL